MIASSDQSISQVVLRVSFSHAYATTLPPRVSDHRHDPGAGRGDVPHQPTISMKGTTSFEYYHPCQQGSGL
jgi:hypothetical protein